MVSDPVVLLSLVLVGLGLILTSFYLRIVRNMYRKEPFSIGRFFLWFFSLRVAILMLQIIGLLLFPLREMLSDTVALGYLPVSSAF